MPLSNYQKAHFLLSVANKRQLPADEGIEIAFAGRSNAGKSSVLNTLTQQKQLARTSKTPGRTQLINLFAIDDQRRLVDLPGYGYAKVPEAIKMRWYKTLNDYFDTRQCLAGVVLIMDIRHPLKQFDLDMLDWSGHHQLPVHILLNKADKLSRNQAMQSLSSVKKAIGGTPGQITIQTFSALKHSGLDELVAKLDELMELAP